MRLGVDNIMAASKRGETVTSGSLPAKKRHRGIPEAIFLVFDKAFLSLLEYYKGFPKFYGGQLQRTRPYFYACGLHLLDNWFYASCVFWCNSLLLLGTGCVVKKLYNKVLNQLRCWARKTVPVPPSILGNYIVKFFYAIVIC